MSRRPDYDPSVPVYDLSGEEIHEWDDDAGQLAALYVQEGDDLTLISYTYRAYSEEEVVRNDNERVDDSIRERSIEFFVDGGKRAMEQAIEDASSSSAVDPQIQAIARMQVMAMDLTGYTSTQVVGFRDYWPEWQPDTKYEYQQPLRHKGLYYRASKALTSSSIYPPDTAGESEYYPIEVAPDGVIVYRECHGQYDMVQAGETRHYSGADGPVYRAKVDTAYDPDTVPDNWELGSDADSE